MHARIQKKILGMCVGGGGGGAPLGPGMERVCALEIGSLGFEETNVSSYT